jgi:hypothetical protein
MAAGQENELALSTHTRRMRFSGPLTGVLCKRPFPEFVAKIRIQRQRSSADIYRSCEQNCNRPAAFKNATVRERPLTSRSIFSRAEVQKIKLPSDYGEFRQSP